MTNWTKLYKSVRVNDPKHRRAILRSRKNSANPATVKHGRRHKTR